MMLKECFNKQVFVFKDFLNDSALINSYLQRSLTKFNSMPIRGPDDWESRTIEITKEPIVQKVKSFLESQLNLKLECHQAQTQVWPIGMTSSLHIHDMGGRESTDYNSLIYLNDDFDGGEFYTKTVSFKPIKGSLTFFDGRNVHHGVREVKRKHRHTLIFWWKNSVLDKECYK